MCSVFFEHASERADMLVPGVVNECPVNVVIDTGSAATLSEDFADRLYKELEKETSDQGPKSIGANGQPPPPETRRTQFGYLTVLRQLA